MADAISTTKAVSGTAAVVAGVAAVAVTAKQMLGSTPNAAVPTVAPGQISIPAFLNRATFGANDASMASLALLGTTSWLSAQVSAAPTAGGSPGYWTSTPNFHLGWIVRRQADVVAAYKAAVAANGGATTSTTTSSTGVVTTNTIRQQKLTSAQFQESFWARAVQGDDQLRHRMVLALSEIFVVSFESSTITPRIAASWYDMLSQYAFGSYLDLLKAVTLHPAMGIYLNIVGNQQADTDPSRHPDENYAREVLQLMSIGLAALNMDGSTKLDTTGAPIAPFSHADIQGLANVFTGWGWYAAKPTATTFAKQPADGSGLTDPDVQPLIAYPLYHSQLQKNFLGAGIAAYTGAQPTSAAGATALAAYQTQSLNTALTVISHHPNVAPFIGRQLIQRFVTSNPSPAYIARVATAFIGDTTQPSTYGNLFATLKAVLTDPEAMSLASGETASFGKLREPVVRMAHWLRACEVSSKATSSAPSGNFTQFTDFGDAAELDQAPLEALSVFNFWTPYYVPPASNIATAGLVAPEFQAVDVLTVAAYANLMIQVVQNQGWPGGDVTVTFAKELAALATSGGDQALIDRINSLFFGNTMSPVLSARLTRVLGSTQTTAKTPTAAQISAVQLYKVKNAFLIALTSPEYVVQR